MPIFIAGVAREINTPISKMEQMMQQLLEAGRRFRQASPTPGSASMIQQITEMVNIYDHLSEVILSADERERNKIVSALQGMMWIKRRFLDEDWETLGRNTMLYGLEGAFANEDRAAAVSR